MKIKRVNGFSVVELIIAMIIFAIITAFASSTFRNYRQNMNLREASQDLVSDILLIKQRASAESSQYTITFDVANNKYIVQASDTYEKSPASFNNSIVISSAVFGGPTPNVITFQQRGTTNAGTIILSNNLGSQATIKTTLMGKVYATYAMH